MDKFSDNYPKLTSQDEASMPLKIRECFAFLRNHYGVGAINVFKAENIKAIYISITLEVSKPNRATDFLKKEPILFAVDTSRYPHVIPKVYSDRKDFPASNTPHVNPVSAGEPYSLCLFRGDSNSWFAQHSIIDLVERARGWLEDAAAGNLNHPLDDFEYTRIDSPSGLIFFSEQDAIDMVNEGWNKSNGQVGGILCSYLDLDLKKDESKFKTYWLMELHGLIINANDPVIKNNKHLPGYILYPEKDFVDDNYITELPGNIFSLKQWARKYNIDLSALIESHLSGTISRNTPITFVIPRPRKVINHNSNLELLTFLVIPSTDNDITDDCVVESSWMVQKNSKALAKHLSGNMTEDYYENIHIIGLGAIGSKLALHLARSGIIPTSLIDNDYLLPHNNIRNGLVATFGSKTTEVLKAIQKLYLGSLEIGKSITDYPFTILDVLDRSPKLFSNSKDLIIDCTASYAVEDFMNNSIHPKGARYSRVEIADQGRISFVRVEGANRNPRIDDLMIEAYDMAVEESSLSKWLIGNQTSRQSFTTLDEIYLGLNCSSDTLILSDDKVGYHTALASISIKKTIKHFEEDAHLQINFIDESEDWVTKNITKKIKPVTIVSTVNNPGWQIRLRTGLLQELLRLSDKNKPNETGGIFIGKIDQLNKIVYVTRIVNAPPDSEQLPYLFTRGTEGLTNLIAEVRKKTGGMLDYVGEWHTHPDGSARLSSTDKNAISEIRKVLDPVGYPTCVSIINGKKIHPYIFTKFLNNE